MKTFNSEKVFGSRTLAVAAASLLVMGGATLGCSTKNYVKAQTAPIVQSTNDLDAKTAADHNAIRDTDERATKGIAGAQSAADQADQHAMAAGQSADKANGAAADASHRVDTLDGVIAGLDKYQQLSDVSVTFKFDKAALTASDKKQLDALAGSLQTARGFLLEVTGGTDTTGDKDYNYRLSQRRADAVVDYLSAKYGVPPHKFYLVGIGKDVQVASDRTAAGRAQNRRVEVKVMSNMGQTTASAAGN